MSSCMYAFYGAISYATTPLHYQSNAMQSNKQLFAAPTIPHRTDFCKEQQAKKKNKNYINNNNNNKGSKKVVRDRYLY